jgi:hypothetical protein
MSINDKVTVSWLTEDEWNGKEHSAKRKCIDPASPEALYLGQRVRVKFDRRWFPALVVTPWSGRKNAKKKPDNSNGKSNVSIVIN